MDEEAGEINWNPSSKWTYVHDTKF